MHDLRHAFAVRTYQATKGVYAVKTALGHANVSVTETYLRSLGFVEAWMSNFPCKAMRLAYNVARINKRFHQKVRGVLNPGHTCSSTQIGASDR